jgi:hypothetical protein
MTRITLPRVDDIDGGGGRIVVGWKTQLHPLRFHGA